MTVVLKQERKPHWRSDRLEITIDADEWGKEIAEELLKQHVEAIKSNRNPEGRQQKPLAPDGGAARAAAKGLRPKARAFTEHQIFIRSLRARKVRGNKRRSEYQVTTNMPDVFFEWLVREDGRGVEYFADRGEAAKAATAVAKRLLDRAIK